MKAKNRSPQSPSIVSSPPRFTSTEASAHNIKIHFKFILLLLLASLIATARAQEALVLAALLNAVIHAALQKPSAPVTAQGLLSLTGLAL
jgi:hypothetical protein